MLCSDLFNLKLYTDEFTKRILMKLTIEFEILNMKN